MNPIALIGIPYDEKSSFLKGPAKAPALIREAFYSGASNRTAENGIDTARPEVEDRGDLLIDEYFQIEEKARELLDQGFRLVSLGGDHSITFPMIQAYSQVYEDIHILQIDAHPDLYHEFEGDPYSHACPFARIMENGLAGRLVQVGIRTLNAHQRDQAHRFGVEIHEMKDFSRDRIPAFQKPVYISLDLDGLDPAFAPGVSHREPGGLSTRQVLDILQQIDVPIIGADIVEYNPQCDHQGVTASVAAKLMKEILGKMLEEK